MHSVFISSVQRDYGEVRAAVAQAVETYGKQAVMAERAPATDLSPKGALLGAARNADAMILILGARYGDTSAGEASPTEDEFNEARRAGRLILVLVEDVAREPAQEEFLRRVRGSWPEGSLTVNFSGPVDAALKATQGLLTLERATGARDLQPQAAERAIESARGPNRSGTTGHDPQVRIVLVPLVADQLIDDATLNRTDFADQLIATAREVGLIPQTLGVEPTISSREGVHLHASGTRWGSAVTIGLDRLGAIVVELNVQSEGLMGSMVIDPDRLATAIDQTGDFASRAWRLIDPSQRITAAYAAIGILNPQMRAYGRSTGSSVSTGMGGRQETLVVPDPLGAPARRADVGTGHVRDGLLAAVERAFRDARAVTGI